MDAVGLCYGPVFPTPRVLHNLITPDLPRLARYLGTRCAVAAHLNEDNPVRHVESLSHRLLHSSIGRTRQLWVAQNIDIELLPVTAPHLHPC